jgi:hypothetical protein
MATKVQPVAWDEATGAALVCPARPPNAAPEARLALRGRYTVPTLRGAICCRPVFERLAERCRAWPAARVAEVTGIPAEQIEAAANLIAENLPLVLLHLDRHLPAQQRHPERPRHRHALRPDRLPGCARRQCLVQQAAAGRCHGFRLGHARGTGAYPGPGRAPARAAAKGLDHQPRPVPRRGGRRTLSGHLFDLLRQQLPAFQAQYPIERGSPGSNSTSSP